MKVVIVGAGFGGLRLARKLNNKAGFEVILIDRFNYHQFQPLFYQVATAGLDELKTKSGTVDWRTGLANHLIKLQDANGSWKNTASSRWMEGDPVLVTAYTVLALEHVHRALK